MKIYHGSNRCVSNDPRNLGRVTSEVQEHRHYCRDSRRESLEQMRRLDGHPREYLDAILRSHLRSPQAILVRSWCCRCCWCSLKRNEKYGSNHCKILFNDTQRAPMFLTEIVCLSPVVTASPGLLWLMRHATCTIYTGEQIFVCLTLSQLVYICLPLTRFSVDTTRTTSLRAKNGNSICGISFLIAKTSFFKEQNYLDRSPAQSCGLTRSDDAICLDNLSPGARVIAKSVKVHRAGAVV